jgi:hypothetical protein
MEIFSFSQMVNNLSGPTTEPIGNGKNAWLCSGYLCETLIPLGEPSYDLRPIFNTPAYACSQECLKEICDRWNLL